MPGNETKVRSDRVFPPAFWKKTGVTAGQTTGEDMDIAGITRNVFTLPRDASLMSVGVVLTAPVTAGLIRFEITKNGVPTGKTFDMTDSTGAKQIWEFKAGELTGDKGDDIGFQWGSSGTLAPSGTIEAVLYIELQFYG
jgi:hypothetical protein